MTGTRAVQTPQRIGSRRHGKKGKSQAAPAALLFLAGTKDESVPPEDARRFHQAASQPKEVRWYEAGHFLNCTAREDMMASLLSRLLSTWSSRRRGCRRR
jgi:fermentation-respiration switch protein FrsA (DUF1100 family)